MPNGAATAVVSGNPTETKSDHFREIYSNFSRVGLTPFDMSLAFGTIKDATPGEPMGVMAEVLIRMSPHQFKSFANSLPMIMAEWESRFGVVNLPPQFLTSPESMHAALAEAEQKILDEATANAQKKHGKHTPKKTL